MKDKVILIVMIVSLAFNLGVLGMFVFRVIGKHNADPGIKKDMREMREKLELTNKQEKDFKESRDEMREEVEPLLKEMEDKRREAFKLLEEPELDVEKRDKLFGEIAELQIEIESAMFNHLYKIKGELTPEQQEIFLETMEDKICPKGGPMGSGPGFGRGKGGPGFNKGNMRGNNGKPFNEEKRREHYEEMEKEFEGGPGGPFGPGGNIDSGEPGGNP